MELRSVAVLACRVLAIVALQSYVYTAVSVYRKLRNFYSRFCTRLENVAPQTLPLALLLLPVIFLPPLTADGQTRRNYAEASKVEASSVDVSKIVADRKQTIAALLEILKNPGASQKYGGDLDNAINMLGYIRSTEAVELLAERLSFLSDTSGEQISISPFVTEAYYRSAAALVRIGEPSDMKRQMLLKISRSENDLDRALASWVLISIYSKETTLQLLRDYEKESGGTNKSRVARTVSYVDTYRPSVEDPRSIDSRLGGSICELIELQRTKSSTSIHQETLSDSVEARPEK